MATITYTLGERYRKGGLPGGFAHILGPKDGFSKEYVFGQPGDVRPADVTYRHEVDGADLDRFRELLASKGLDRAEFHLAEDAPKAPAK